MFWGDYPEFLYRLYLQVSHSHTLYWGEYLCGRNECSYSTAVCGSLSSHTDEEEAIERRMQKYYVMYRSIAQSVIPAIIVIIIGKTWSQHSDVLELSFQGHYLTSMAVFCLLFCLFSWIVSAMWPTLWSPSFQVLVSTGYSSHPCPSPCQEAGTPSTYCASVLSMIKVTEKAAQWGSVSYSLPRPWVYVLAIL